MKASLTLFAIVLMVSLLTCSSTVSAAIIRHSQQFVDYVATETLATQLPQIPEEALQLANEIKSLTPELSNPEIQRKLLETSKLLEEGNIAKAISNHQELMDYATALLESGELNVEEYGELLRIFSQIITLAEELPVNQQIVLRNYYASYMNSLSDKLYYEGIISNNMDLIELAKELKDLSYALKYGDASLNDVERILSTLEKLSSEKQVTPEALEDINQSLNVLRNMVSMFPKQTESTLQIPGGNGLSSFVKNYVGSLRAPSITMPSLALGSLASNMTTLMYVGAIVAVMVLTYFLIMFLRKIGVKVSVRKVVEKITYTVGHEIAAKARVSRVVEAYWYAVGFLSKLIPKLNCETHREYLRKVQINDVREDFEKLTFLYEKDRFSRKKADEKESEEAEYLAKKIESNVLKRI